MPTLYAPGRTPVAVTPRGFAVLEPGASAALLARIRALLADGRGLGGVIEALTGAYGASISAIPAFAVALAEGDAVRIAVRGGFAFDVDATTSESVSGAGVTTWTERVIPAALRVTLTTTDDEVSAPAEFEISDGIVHAAAVVWDAAPAGASSPPPSAQPGAGAGASDPGPASAASALGAGAENLGDRGDAPGSAPGVRRVGSPAMLPSTAEEETPSAEPGPAAASDPAPVAPDLRWHTVAPISGVPGSSVPSASAAPAPPQTPPAPTGAATPGLIDSSTVQSVADAETLLPLDSARSVHAAAFTGSTGPGPDDMASTTGFDDLWGVTVIKSPEGAGGLPEPPDDAAAAAPATAGDHDGATISLAQARALREAAAAAAAGGAASVPVADDAAASPLAPPRPPAPGRIRVSTGQVLPLDRTIVIGRRPRSTRVSGTDLPHLVAVDSPQQDISRSHVELRVEGESIVATDLRTTNGTTLLRAGADPVRLHPGEGTVVVPGDVLDLGDGITVAIEGLS
ncbi:FHA domain-containing protein [Microbacterium ureisolvens]|uniref:FHA domain-containing protein n=1 Tax=Microbacterium ureisolvens TaxID=2781186 RepID=UPI003627B6FD